MRPHSSSERPHPKSVISTTTLIITPPPDSRRSLFRDEDGRIFDDFLDDFLFYIFFSWSSSPSPQLFQSVLILGRLRKGKSRMGNSLSIHVAAMPKNFPAARRSSLGVVISSSSLKGYRAFGGGGLAEVQIMDLMDYLDSPAMVSPDATVQRSMSLSRRVRSLLTCSPAGEIIGVFTGATAAQLVMHADKRQALSAPVSDIMTPAERMVYCSPEIRLAK